MIYGTVDPHRTASISPPFLAMSRHDDINRPIMVIFLNQHTRRNKDGKQRQNSFLRLAGLQEVQKSLRGPALSVQGQRKI